MPQLDRIIVFSQIFWLFIIFTLFYTILTHFFLPKFIKSLKIRKQIIDKNSLEIVSIAENTLKIQNLLKKNVLKDLESVKTLLIQHFSNLVKEKSYANPSLIDEKISFVILNTLIYCDLQLLNSIIVYPKVLKYKN
uniref:ATP synthase F0 subunit 8 n=1 Tax=Gracilariopsis longissima TaxID=172976 RepID=A0A345UBK1_9FLOR|nr:ATP synthase F0 subunit 8 [Gracilariopsis longissima]AXI97837.1 ATP synthase F0 subunit 8 [Gracilariopsis longissima]UAD89939.1 ATP synthase F0 subunit 8 [Gracilariopsis longissima]